MGPELPSTNLLDGAPATSGKTLQALKAGAVNELGSAGGRYGLGGTRGSPRPKVS
jgi:hypothetical protein